MGMPVQVSPGNGPKASMLRHAKPETSALYIHRVNATEMAAQGKYLEAINVSPAVN
jgi:hypothetical protein